MIIGRIPGSSGTSGSLGVRLPRRASNHLVQFRPRQTIPEDGIAADPVYLDVSVPPGHRKTLPIETTHHSFAYVFAGAGKFCNASGPLAVPTETVKWSDTNPPSEADNRSLVLFDRGDEVVVQAGEDGIRFLLVSGKPLEEPVAWYGPIVMNTQEQLLQAFQDLDKGTFLKSV